MRTGSEKRETCLLGQLDQRESRETKPCPLVPNSALEGATMGSGFRGWGRKKPQPIAGIVGKLVWLCLTVSGRAQDNLGHFYFLGLPVLGLGCFSISDSALPLHTHISTLLRASRIPTPAPRRNIAKWNKHGTVIVI